MLNPVHLRTLAAVVRHGSFADGELIQTRLTPSHKHIRSWLSDLSGPVAVAYEAGPTGFGLAQSVIAAPGVPGTLSWLAGPP